MGEQSVQEKMQFHDCRAVGCLSPAALKRLTYHLQESRNLHYQTVHYNLSSQHFPGQCLQASTPNGQNIIIQKAGGSAIKPLSKGVWWDEGALPILLHPDSQ